MPPIALRPPRLRPRLAPEPARAAPADPLRQAGVAPAAGDRSLSSLSSIATDELIRQPRLRRIDVDADDFERRLAAAARAHRFSTGSGNGQYRRLFSVMRPVVKHLRSGAFDTAYDLQKLESILAGLPADKAAKYTGPIRELERTIAEAWRALEAPDEAQSERRRQTVHRRLTRQAKDEDLSSRERYCISAYKRPGGFSDINNALRGLKPFKRQAYQRAARMVDGMRKLPAFHGEVYRGAGCLIGGVREPVVGQVYSDPAFLSTSAERAGITPGPFEMVIEARGGFVDIARVRDDRQATQAALEDREAEVLGFPGVRLEYLGEADGIHRYREVEGPAMYACRAPAEAASRLGAAPIPPIAE